MPAKTIDGWKKAIREIVVKLMVAAIVSVAGYAYILSAKVAALEVEVKNNSAENQQQLEYLIRIEAKVDRLVDKITGN